MALRSLSLSSSIDDALLHIRPEASTDLRDYNTRLVLQGMMQYNAPPSAFACAPIDTAENACWVLLSCDEDPQKKENLGIISIDY